MGWAPAEVMGATAKAALAAAAMRNERKVERFMVGRPVVRSAMACWRCWSILLSSRVCATNQH